MLEHEQDDDGFDEEVGVNVRAGDGDGCSEEELIDLDD
jgi:hypothetical protein